MANIVFSYVWFDNVFLVFPIEKKCDDIGYISRVFLQYVFLQTKIIFILFKQLCTYFFLTMFSLNMPSQSRFCNSWVITEVTLPGFNPCVNHNMSHDISFVRHFFETIRTTITTSVKFYRLCCITLQDEKNKTIFQIPKIYFFFSNN